MEAGQPGAGRAPSCRTPASPLRPLHTTVLHEDHVLQSLVGSCGPEQSWVQGGSQAVKSQQHYGGCPPGTGWAEVSGSETGFGQGGFFCRRIS